MYKTIILAVCLTQTPTICKEVKFSVEPDAAGSLQLPFHCVSARTDGSPEVVRGECRLAR